MNENRNTAPPEDKEGRINALQQLLSNSVPDVVQALEGGGDLAIYKELRQKREAWRVELAELTKDDADPEQAIARALARAAESEPVPDIVLTTISNAEIIEKLTGVIVQQAGIIHQLHSVVGQLGAVTSMEAEIVKLQIDTAALVGEFEDTMAQQGAL